MGHYLARRLLLMVVVLTGISMMTFFLSFVMPGDPARAIAGPRASEEALDTLREKWGLDQPLPIQYLRYMGRLLRGDLGRSYYTRLEVLPAIIHRLPATLRLAAAGILAELLIGIPVGILSAVKQYSWTDRVGMIGALLGICLPTFFLGLLLLYFFAYKLSLFPLGGIGGIHYMILPALTIGLAGGAWYARVLRSSMLDILHADYIRTARAKGLTERVVIGRHALRNAIGPIVTMIGADIGFFFGGILVIEKVFAWPGIGLQAWTAIDYLDVPMIMGTVLVAAVFIVSANLAVDILRFALDPRIRDRAV